MFNLCSENKGADQLRGYREADLRLCFRICKKPVFSRRGPIARGLKFGCRILAVAPVIAHLQTGDLSWQFFAYATKQDFSGRGSK